METNEIVRQRSEHPFEYFHLSHAIHGPAQLVVVVLFISSQLLTLVKMPPYPSPFAEFFGVHYVVHYFIPEDNGWMRLCLAMLR